MGTKTKQKKLSDTQAVYNRYKYFHLMFISRAAWGFTYVLSTLEADGWAYKEIS